MGHFTWPKNLNLAAGNIGELPSETSCGDPMVREWLRQRNWTQNQIFSFSGPGPGLVDIDDPEYNPDYDYDYDYDQPCYDVIYSLPTKADTSNVPRQLYGVVIPWRVVPYYNRMYDMVTTPAQITWESYRDSRLEEQTLWRSTSPTADWGNVWENRDRIGSPIELYNRESEIQQDQNCDLPHLHCYRNFGSGTLAKVSSSPTPYSGDYCVKLTASAANDSIRICRQPGTTNNFYTKEGCIYNLRGRYITDGSISVTLDAGGAVATLGAIGAWTEFNETFTAEQDGVVEFLASASGWFALDNIKVKEKATFKYDPPSGGRFGVGYLRTKRMRVASICIWQCPDHTLTDAQAIMYPGNCGAGRAIRGRSASDGTSLGTIIHRMGRFSDNGDDDCERNTRRCLLGWGHPLGVYNSKTSYSNIRAGRTSSFRVRGRNLRNNSGANSVLTYPVLTAYVEGASGGNPAYVRYTSANGGSPATWVASITDSGGLINDDLSFGSLYIGSGIDDITIETQAPSSGSIRVKTFGLWEAATV
jgi:hypothetical protein